MRIPNEKKFATVILVGILFLTGIMVISPESEAYKKGVTYKIAYFNPDVTVEDPVAAVSAMKPFTNFLGKKLEVKLEPYFFKKQADLEQFLNNNTVGFGIFSQMYIVENHKKRNFVPVAIVMKEGQPFYRKVVLVRKDSTFNSLDDLKGKSLATTALGEENIPFLNKVVFRGEIDVKRHFGKLNVVDSANSAIMAVLYKQVDAAAANYLNFVFLKELNPQVGKQLKIIFTSAKTPLPGLVYFKDVVPEDFIDVSLKEILTMHESPIGAQTMLAFQVEAWGPASLKDWEETAHLLGMSLSGEPLKRETPPPMVAKAEAGTKSASPSGEKSEETKPVEEAIRFKRVIAEDDAEKNRVTVSVTIVQNKPGINEKSVKLMYRINGESQNSEPMTQAEGGVFSAQIALPELKKSTGEQRITYTIKPGDTLGKIAKKTLGDSRKYMVIARLNNIKNPNLIYAGATLKILKGGFSGFDIDYSIEASDKDGRVYHSKSKFLSVVR